MGGASGIWGKRNMNRFYTWFSFLIRFDKTNAICDSRLSICILWPRWAKTKHINITVWNFQILTRRILSSRYCLKVPQDCPPTSHVCVSWYCWSGFKNYFQESCDCMYRLSTENKTIHRGKCTGESWSCRIHSTYFIPWSYNSTRRSNAFEIEGSTQWTCFLWQYLNHRLHDVRRILFPYSLFQDCNIVSVTRFEISCVLRDRLDTLQTINVIFLTRDCAIPFPPGICRVSDRCGRVLGTSFSMRSSCEYHGWVSGMGKNHYVLWFFHLCFL